ncbi:hypothetical protein [Desulfobulbus sp.]|uniref:hypothetical protein n=1 Tax=Desulfobulbus sp. TaxID=895 RepID=UPI0027B97F1B|nr:hypothetical protein [Desulfobulbus sp.]
MDSILLKASRLSLICALAFLAGCATQGVTVPGSSVAGKSAATAFNGYEPIDPVATPQVFLFDSPDKGSNKLWSAMDADTRRKNLPNQTSTTTIKKVSGEGKITYLSATANAAAGTYEVVMDFAKYRSEPVYDSGSGTVSGGTSVPNDTLLGYGKIGVGVRIKANVETLQSGVDLNGLFALGLAAKQSLLRGTISVDVIGIDSKGVNALLPVGVQLDESSIQASLQSLASIQTKIYDGDVTLTPHLIAIRRGKPIVGAVDEKSDPEKARFIQQFQSIRKQ